MAENNTADATDGRVFQRIVDYVQNAVAAGELKPGDRLPSERELVEQFSVGRASVREALRVLQSMQLVHSTPRDRRGPVILPMSVEPVRRSVSMLASAQVFTLADLVQFRMVADAAANLLAAYRRTDAQLVELERNMARMRNSMSRGYAEFSRIDLEFHEIIAAIGGNQLVQVYGDVTREAVVDLIRKKILDADDRTSRMLQSVRHHRAVFDALVDRDGMLASRLARETIYAYYADYVDDADRAVMADLVEECGGRIPD